MCVYDFGFITLQYWENEGNIPMYIFVHVGMNGYRFLVHFCISMTLTHILPLM